MNILNPDTLSLWIASATLTYGITGNIQTSILALGITSTITSFNLFYFKLR